MSLETIGKILNVSLDGEVRDRLVAYAEEVCRWNRRVNLTGASDAASFIEGPLFDALTLAPVLAPSGSLVDIGSGGGLPGVPMGLLFPEVALTLVEPRAKRVSFLRHIVHYLGLEAEVIRARDEELPGERWSGAVAQAVFKVPDWIPRGAKLVQPGGSVYVLGTEAVDASSLGTGLSIADAFSCHPPGKNARRHAFRIVRQDASPYSRLSTFSLLR